ncbi:MAG: CotH kinase family protein [Polyangiaceae bacterium]|nr:CotH kinase family protein [Polyangiaceae bacterium]
MISSSFFIEPAGRDRYPLPVVSLMTDRGDLFDDQRGIYVAGEDPDQPNYDRRGRDWERAVHFELFDRDGERPVAQTVGARIHGHFSRRFPQKTLRLYARKEYGTAWLEHPFFSTKSQRRYKRLLLRNGGNDWGALLMRDATLQGLVRHLSLDMQHVQPAVVFINGEYWGLHNIRDRLDEHYLETHHSVPRDEVTIIEGNATVEHGEATEGADLSDFLGGFEGGVVEAEFDSYFALPELLDYAITECYAANSDWPGNNIAYWRYAGPSGTVGRGPRDRRFRPLLFDVDNTLGARPGVEFDMTRHLFVEAETSWSRRLYRGIVQDPAVRREFVARTAIHLATTFHPERVEQAILEAFGCIETELPQHIARWRHPQSLENYHERLEAALDFAERRPSVMREHFVQYFDEVTGTAELRIAPVTDTQGLSLHGVRLSPGSPGVILDDGDTWRAVVFAGVPVVLESETLDLSAVEIEGDGTEVEVRPARIEWTPAAGEQLTLNLPRG